MHNLSPRARPTSPLSRRRAVPHRCRTAPTGRSRSAAVRPTGATPATLVRFRSLAQRLGEWPLLLQLANRWLYEQVARKATVERALDFANQVYDRLGVVAFDRRNAAARDEAIGKTVELSLGLLNGRPRAMPGTPGIFPEDADVPLDVVAVVWGKDRTDTEILATRMDVLGLVKAGPFAQARPGGLLRSHAAARCHELLFRGAALSGLGWHKRSWQTTGKIPSASPASTLSRTLPVTWLRLWPIRSK